MRKRSLLLLAGAVAIIASLVVGPAATAGPEQGVGGDGRVHSRPGAAQPSPGLGRQHAVCDEPRPQQHLPGRPDPRQQREVGHAALHGTPKLLKKSPLTTEFTFSPKAKWSDGKPVTGADWKCDVADLDQPGEQPGVAAPVRGHQVRQLQGQDRHGRLQEGVRGLGDAPERPASGLRKYTAGKDVNKLWEDSIPVSERPLEVPELAEGHPDHGRQEPEVHDRAR